MDEAEWEVAGGEKALAGGREGGIPGGDGPKGGEGGEGGEGGCAGGGSMGGGLLQRVQCAPALHPEGAALGQLLRST